MKQKVGKITFFAIHLENEKNQVKALQAYELAQNIFSAFRSLEMSAPVVWTKDEEAQNYSIARPDYPKNVVDISLAYLRQNYDQELDCALDIGCGTGKSTEHLIPVFKKVYGCDPSEAMLTEARKIYKKHGQFFRFA